MKSPIFKILKVFSNVAVIVGIFLIITTVGTSDYYTEVGIYYPTNSILKSLGIAVLLFIPRTVIACLNLEK